MQDKRVALSEEVIEPELVSPGGSEPRRGRTPRPPRPARAPGLIARVKGLLAAGLAVLGAGLLFTGALLTSTIIGAVIGIPLMLIGALCLYLLFKLLASGSGRTVIFRRF